MRNIFVSTSSYAEHSKKPLQILKSKGYRINLNTNGRKLSSKELFNIIETYDGVIAGTEEYNKHIIDKTKNLKVISRLGVGLDNIDINYAEERDIKIFKTNTTPAMAVAELSLAMILSLLRCVTIHDNDLRNMKWEKNMGSLLYSKTIGIIGLGTIGKTLVEITKGFNLKYFACDIFKDYDFADKHNVQYKKLEYLLSHSDVISIHLSYSKDLKNLIDKDRLNLMKSNSIIINTSRGGIINETDLKNALSSGTIAGAGLDVFSEEPYFGQLKNSKNVILTPHIGSYAKEIRVKMEMEAAENLILGFDNV